MADEAACTLPFLVCDADPVAIGSASPSLPALVCLAGGVWEGTAELTLVPIGMSAEAVSGPGGTASITMPLLTLVAESSFNAEIDLPILTITAFGYEVGTGVALLGLPAFSLLAAGGAFRDGSASISLPGLSLAASVASGTYGIADLHLPFPTMVATGASGSDGVATIELAQLTLAAAAHQTIAGTASIDLPQFWLEANSYTSPADVWRTWAMNLSTKAVTEFTNFEFTSYIEFGGNVYASSANGVYKLDDSNTDEAVNIYGAFATGNYNFDDSHTKRVPRIYVEMKATGDMRFSTTVPVGGTRGYGLYYDGVDAPRTRRIPIGRGPRSVTWKFGANNMAGSYFEVSRILAHPEIMRRRVF